jgi:hypothetical protein
VWRVSAYTAAGRLKDHTKIALRAGRIITKYKMAKHFDLSVDQGVITWSRRTDRIDAEQAIDGIYLVRTSLPPNEIGAAEASRGMDPPGIAGQARPLRPMPRPVDGHKWA